VVGIDVPEDRQYASEGSAATEAPLASALAVTRGFVSASVLAQKAKQFDDGLYAAVEEAAQRGAGRFAGKANMLIQLARSLESGAAAHTGNAEVVVLSACKLGHLPVDIRPPIEPEVRLAINEFTADKFASTPIGFYTWSGPLSTIYRQDRMLQTELEGVKGIAALARAVHANSSIRTTYQDYLALVTRLTNSLAKPDLRGPLHTLDVGGSDFPAKGLAFFPAARSHETDLINLLYKNRPTPAGFNLGDEMVRRIQFRLIDLTPTASSGWYDYQTWSLETLAAPERAAEAAKLRLTDAYRRQLAALVKGILALTRETHVKQLELPAPTARPRPKVVVIDVKPELSAEPLATYYARRAASYRFVRSVLEDPFGPDALRGLHRLTAAGPVTAGLRTELESMEAIFAGASATVCRELGLPETITAAWPAAPGQSADADSNAFRRWARALNSDPDLSRDARMMVPLFFDRDRRKIKVWVFLGWAQRPVHVWFESRPKVEVTRNGKAVNPGEFTVEFGTTRLSLSYPVTAEVYVDRLLDRNEFQRLCDRFQTQSEILRQLH
jgi:hypothetical protein